MQKSPSWERNNHLANQEIPCLMWNPNVHYCVHKGLPLLILSHMHPIHTFPPIFLKIHSSITFPSTPSSSEWSLPVQFPEQNSVCISQLSHVCYMTCPSHLPWLDHSNSIWCSTQVMNLLIVNLIQPPATSSFLGPNILLSTVFKHPQSIFFHQCERLSFIPYKTIGKL